jgi:uncharacterized damage-inducible protein DinB
VSETQHLAEALTSLFSETDNGWFDSFNMAVSGLDAGAATTKPAPNVNTIWGLVNHITFCQEFALRRLRGEEWISMDEDWTPGNPQDEEGWQAAIQRASQVNQQLAQAIAELTVDELERTAIPERATKIQVILGVMNHNSYHICEISTTRHLLGLPVAGHI